MNGTIKLKREMKKFNYIELKDKIYLSKLSIVKYRDYYIELLKNVDFVIADYLEDYKTDYKDIKFEKKKILIRKEYLEEKSIVRISLDLVKALEKHFKDMYIFEKKNVPSSKMRKFDGENDVAIDDTDGNKDDEKKFWENKIKNAAKRIGSLGDFDKLPANAKLIYEDEKEENIDWRKELKEYLLIDTSDYTFTPPDKRYGESDIFLPAYNEVDEDLKNILFVFDTSSSMKKEIVSKVFAEVKNITSQFRANMRGYIASFDTKVYGINEFDSIRDLDDIIMNGGGGTDFRCIYEYIKENVIDIEFKAIVILTDGYGEFPYIWETMDIPTIWVMTEKVKPPFGKLVRYNINEN